MNKRFLILLSLCFALRLGAKAQDSLVTFKELQFNSDFEKKVLTRNFKEGDFQPLQLLLSLSNSMTDAKAAEIENQVREIADGIKTSDLAKKKPDKRIKLIYEKVHNPLLRKYELENRFHEIFVNGNYNCVTATALYALVFNALDIPYEIKEEPTHVYLLGYPDKENIIVETTTPLFGYLTFNEEFKLQYVSNLKKQKVIGAEDTRTTNELFNKYYFKNEKISLKELIGLHYMNDALFKKDHDNWREGYAQLEKAFLFYPSQRCRYLLRIFGSQIMAHEKLAPKEKALLVGKLSRLSSSGITPDMIKGEFVNLTQELLFKENNKSLYQECYQILLSKITDKELAEEINYVYNYESGRAYYNVGNYTKAKPYFEKALVQQPNNLDLGGVFIGVIAQCLRPVENEKGLLDSLHAYKQKYPSLSQFNNFNSLMANATLMNYGRAFDEGHVTEAAKLKESFDALMKEFPAIEINYNVAGKAYSSACTYYFRKGQKVKAREVLMEGLKISPDNFPLRTRLQMIH